MAMVGSVITRDMLPNHIYAGVPAVDMSENSGINLRSAPWIKRQPNYKNSWVLFSPGTLSSRGKSQSFDHPKSTVKILLALMYHVEYILGPTAKPRLCF